MGEWIRFAFCALFVCAGLTAVVSATVGVWRMKEPLCEMHAGAMIDTLALLSFVLASFICFGFGFENIKMAATVVFMWMTSPISSHLLSRLELLSQKGDIPISLPDESLDEASGEPSEKENES